MAITTIIGLKHLDIAKQRLAPHLGDLERRRLMLRMLESAAAAARSAGLGPVAIATTEPSGPAIAEKLGVALLSDGGLPWNQGLVHALASLPSTPERVMFLAGDLPLLRDEELGAFAAASPAPGVGIARARDAGTNALLLTPADAIMPSFGSTSSSEVHAAAARASGLAHVVVELPGLTLDVDTVDDARDAGLLLVSGTGRAPRAG